ncbi:MAG: RNHCP domain-containing protein [Thermomicrobiales bacterium]
MRYHDVESIEDQGDTYRDQRRQRGNRRRRRDNRDWAKRPDAKPFRADGRESFKCGHCKAFIGPTVSGGRHRNHCPLCLYSRHVDGSTPGDRASGCRSLMAPVGTFHRPKGEQAIVHRCLGCGLERHCRVAADDNIVTCLHLPLVAPRTGRVDVVVMEDEEVAIA